MATVLDQRIRAGVNFRDYVTIVVRRKWIILMALASTVVATVFFVYRIPDIYESNSTIVIEEQNSFIADAMMNTQSRSMSFYEGILNSRTYLETVLDTIGLDLFKSTFPRYNRDDALRYIQSALSLQKTTYTSFLSLTARANAKELAFFIASNGTSIFQRRCQEVETETSRRTVIEIEKQLENIRKELEQSEHDFQRYQEQTGDVIAGTTPELKTLQEVYGSNLAQLGIKVADLAAEKTQLQMLETKITPQEFKASPGYIKLREKLDELEKERMRLDNLGIMFSGVSTVDKEIKEIEGELLQYKQPKESSVDPRIMRQWQDLRKSVLNKESEMELFNRRLESYKKAIANYKTENPDILLKSLELQRLKRTKEIYEKIYNILLEKAEEERIKNASTSAGIKVVDVARMPKNPVAKNESRYYLLAIIFGLLFGVGLAFLLEYNDTTIKSNEDIEKYLGIPILGTIPHIDHHKKDDIKINRRSSKSSKKTTRTQYPRNLLDFSGDDSVIAEAYRSLRTNITFASPDHPVQALLLTSAGPGEGKSLTIANLAMAHAQMGKRTLLIDTDLRRPVLHHLFNLSREPGFSELFVETADYDKCIRPTGHENMSIITAGIFTPNPAELIASHRMAQHIEYFRKNFDYIFFDTPPVVAVTDSVLLGAKIDGVLLVVKSHHTDREIAQRALRQLSNVNLKVIGTVLNDIDLTQRYSSYGYYKYYYHYYKSKKD